VQQNCAFASNIKRWITSGGSTLITDYHCKYFAFDLTRHGGRGLDRISQSLFNATVDLNPYQVEAALFALRSPLSKGVLLADEVGLGKTIEAGLVLCQHWAERKRRLLVVCPASIRKQWQIELEDKFNLPAKVMDSRLYRKAQKNGQANPFETPEVVIVSLHFAARMQDEVRLVPWDLVVIDEAHKLRNSYRASNKMGQSIRWALEDKKKVLLTATPLQNSLTELYGLSTVIDDQLFGDLPTFRTLYASADGDLDDLRTRLNSFCIRTLRKDVQEFVRYTERKLTTIKFRPTDDEHKLYEAVSSFLQREETYAFPEQQRHLTVIVVRKVLASSPVALASTLEVIRDRLIGLRDCAQDTKDITERLLEEGDLDEELLDELLDELEIEEDESRDTTAQSPEAVIDHDKLEAEIQEVDHYIRWARSLGFDTKTRHLLKALEIGYEKLAEMGADQKAVIFTESRRTQRYLKDFLEANGYAGDVVTFSGTNRDSNINEIYDKWLNENQHTGHITSSRAIDIRHAIIDHFQKHAKIMIATEAAGEGINLQFCSLLINFDLPWNPQRIEQRIGRVHRYGQKYDVVVVNFLNERNAADQRVYDLLRYKFRLFEGVFGASDDVLGQLESSAGLEKRILDIYQECRTPEQIEERFQKLQEELEQQIQLKMEDTRRKLLEHFDEDAHARLRIDYEDALHALDLVGRKFWRLTKGILKDRALFNDEELSFELKQSPVAGVLPGTYTLIRKRDKRHEDQTRTDADQDGWSLYRLSHPLGEYCIEQSKALDLPRNEVAFSLTGYEARLSALEPYQGRSGWMILNRLIIESIQREEYLLFSGFTDEGQTIEHDILAQMFRLDGWVAADTPACPALPQEIDERLHAETGRFAQATVRRAMEENNKHFLERREQLYRWADDVVAAAERQLKQIKAELRAAERQAALTVTLEEQREAQEQIRVLERKKRSARQHIFQVEDEIENKRDTLITALEKKMVQHTESDILFVIHWSLV
jgi:SNF2 family DNA or RNA helicase